MKLKAHLIAVVFLATMITTLALRQCDCTFDKGCDEEAKVSVNVTCSCFKNCRENCLSLSGCRDCIFRQRRNGTTSVVCYCDEIPGPNIIDIPVTEQTPNITTEEIPVTEQTPNITTEGCDYPTNIPQSVYPVPRDSFEGSSEVSVDIGEEISFLCFGPDTVVGSSSFQIGQRLTCTESGSFYPEIKPCFYQTCNNTDLVGTDGTKAFIVRWPVKTLDEADEECHKRSGILADLTFFSSTFNTDRILADNLYYNMIEMDTFFWMPSSYSVRGGYKLILKANSDGNIKLDPLLGSIPTAVPIPFICICPAN